MTAQQQTIQIRLAGAPDAEALARLALTLVDGAAPWRDRKRLAATARKWALDSATRNDADSLTLLAFAEQARAAGDDARPDGHGAGAAVGADGDDEGAAGYISVRIAKHVTGTPEGIVTELAVADHARRQGVATSLMSSALRWLAGRGVERVSLQTGAGDDVARALYDGLGFEPEAVTLTRAVTPFVGADVGDEGGGNEGGGDEGGGPDVDDAGTRPGGR